MLVDIPLHLLYSRIRQRKTRNDIITMKNEYGDWVENVDEITSLVRSHLVNIFMQSSTQESESETDQ